MLIYVQNIIGIKSMKSLVKKIRKKNQYNLTRTSVFFKIAKKKIIIIHTHAHLCEKYSGDQKSEIIIKNI